MSGYSDTKCEEEAKKDGSQSYRSLRFDLQSLLLDTAKIRITTTDDSILTVRRADYYEKIMSYPVGLLGIRVSDPGGFYLDPDPTFGKNRADSGPDLLEKPD